MIAEKSIESTKCQKILGKIEMKIKDFYLMDSGNPLPEGEGLKLPVG